MSLEKQLADYGRLHEELFGAIEVDEITNPQMAGRYEPTPSSNKPGPQRMSWRGRHAGPAWAVAAFVAVLALGALYVASINADDQVADTPPPPTTVAPDVETSTNLEVIQAGVVALYSGDAERAAELFELNDIDDDLIRRAAAYQAAIRGRLTLDCTEGDTTTLFICNNPYHNAFTDALGLVDSGDTIRVFVRDGVIRQFGFNEHVWIRTSVSAFLEESNPVCAAEFDVIGAPEEFRPPSEECAELIMEHLDEWAVFVRNDSVFSDNLND